MAQILIYADEELKKAVEQAAAEEDRSISNLVRRWIQEGLKQRRSLKAELRPVTPQHPH